MFGDMEAEHISTHMDETLKADPDTCKESNLVEIGSNEPPVEDMKVSDTKEEEHVASTCGNVDFPKLETSVSGPENISFHPSVLADSQSKVETLVSGPMAFTFEPEGSSSQPSVQADSQLRVETSVSGPMPFTFESEGISSQPSVLVDSQSEVETSVSGPMSFTFKPEGISSQRTVLADSQSKVETSVSGPMSSTFEQEGISVQPSVLADSQSKVESSVSGPMQFTFESEGISSQPTVLADSHSKVETHVSGPMSFTSEPEGMSFQPSVLADSQSLQTRLHPLVPRGYSVDRSLAACRSPRSFQLTGKRKVPPESTLGGSASEKPNKRVESVHHRPWLEQFYSASIHPAHMRSTTLSPKTEHSPVPTKKVKLMEPASQRKQVMNKKQTGPSQGSTKTHNEGNESLRSKMKESLAAALALVHEHEESPKEKKNSETDDASVTVGESNEPASACDVSVPIDEGVKAALPTRDESSEQKDERIFPEQTANDTEMNYVYQSDVQRTQYDEVFPCDDGPFSGSFFSSDELLQGNGLSWVLEPVTDFEERKENETGGEKSFEDPNLLASKIELELFKLFGGVNKKYKEKGRSLLFNLKDKNNPELRESVMSGKISPVRLCSMTAEELASKELSQWRQAKAEEMAEMVVLRDADIDVSRLVRKTHKGEFQVEVDPVDSEMVDVCAGITSRSRPRTKAKSMKSSNPAKSTPNKNELNEQNASSDQGAMTLPSTEETDPMQGLSMDDEMKDVGFLPPIVSLDEFMESLNTEPPFGSPQHRNAVKEEVPASEKSDSGAVQNIKSPSRSPKQSSGKACESVSPKTELEKAIVTSPKPDVGVKLSVDVSKPEEEQIWGGLLHLSASSVVSVTAIFKSGEKAKTSEWPTMVEVKGRVKLSAFGKFVQELPLSRSRVLMVINVVCKDGISQSQRDSLFEVAKSYVADQRVGYAEPTSGVELYLCPSRGKTLDLLSKVISKDHLDEAKCSDNIGLIGLVVWRLAVSSPASRHKPGFKRQHSSLKNQPPVVAGTKSSVLAPENKKSSTSLNVKNHHQPPVVAVTTAMGNHGCEDDDDEDLPPGFGPAAVKDDDDLPEFNFNTSTAPPVTSSPRPGTQSRSLNQVRELILKYGNSAGNNASKQRWNDQDDDDDDIPEWQPQVSGHQIQPPPPPPGPPFHSRAMARPQGHGARPSDGWRANQNAPRQQQQQYSGRRNRGF